MTKIARKLVTGLTILGLAAPALAATAAVPPTGAAQVQVAQPKHHRTHRRVAQADQKKAASKEAKASKKHAKTAATKAAPAPAAAPAK